MRVLLLLNLIIPFVMIVAFIYTDKKIEQIIQ